jgi:hypothetical protein
MEFIIGTQTKLELISRTHGAVRVPLAQNFDYTPAFDEKRIYEFDNAEAAAIVTLFNGVEVRFDHYDSDSKLVDAMVNDLDPAATAMIDDPAYYQDVNILLNVKSKTDGKIFQSVLAKAVSLTGAATSEPVRDESVIARSGVSVNVYRLKGVGLEYTRALRAASTAFPQGAANSHTDKVATLVLTNYQWTVDNTPQTVKAKDSALDSKALILVLKNGEVYTGASLAASTISVPSADFGANDVFEAFTSYVD